MLPILPNSFGMPVPFTISTHSWEMIGPMIGVNFTSALASGAWPGANIAYYIPFHLEAPIVIDSLCKAHGSAAAGNVDMGVYSADGRYINSLGGGTMTLTAAWVSTGLTPATYLPPGDYFLGMSASSTSAQFYRYSPGAPRLRAAGCYQQASAYPLPTTVMTPVAQTSNYIPLIGLSQGVR